MTLSTPAFRNATVTTLCLVLLACGTNPVTGKRELQLVSPQQEVSIGEENYLPTKQSQGGEYIVDNTLSKYVSNIGQKLAQVSDRPKLPFEFAVLNNSVPNAWALPGGKIAINRGLLTELNNEAELAAVIGHEIVHAAARHGAKGMERGILMQAGVAAVGIATEDSQNAQWIVGAAALGSNLINQKYGRDAESESDYYGMQYMAKAGYDPSAAVTLQQTFVRLSGNRNSNWLEGLFTSHPPSQERVEANKQTAAKLNVQGELGEQQYKSAIAHLLKTKPAYDAYDKGREAIAKGNLDMAAQLAEQAIKVEPKEGLFYSLKGDIFYNRKDYKSAEHWYSQALKQNDSFYMFYLQRGLTNQKLNDPVAAKSDLEKSIQLLPTAIAHNSLGNLALVAGNQSSAVNHFSVAAKSESDIGKQAAKQLAKLELPQKPGKYFKLGATTTQQNSVGISVTNLANINVNNIQCDVLISDAAGKVLHQERITISATLQAGKSLVAGVRYPVSSMDKSTKISATVVSAQVAE